MASSPASPLIRLATVEDANAIGMIHRVGQRLAAAEALPKTALSITAAQHGEEWRHWLRLQAMGRASGFVLVVDTRQGVGGFLCTVPPRTPDGLGAWTIRHLYVLPAFQGQGLGRRLLAAALARVRSAGAEEIELVTFANSPQRGFHEQQGWQEVGDAKLIIGRTVLAGIRYGRRLDSLPDDAGDYLEGPGFPAVAEVSADPAEVREAPPAETAEDSPADRGDAATRVAPASPETPSSPSADR